MPFFNTKFLRQVPTYEERDRIRESLSWAVRSEPEWVLFKLADWVAVPAPYIIMRDRAFQEHLVQTFLAHGYSELYSVPLGEPDTYVYRVPVTLEGLNEFFRVCFIFSSALFAGESEPEWVMLVIDTEYCIVAGLPEFVCQLLNADVEEAFSRFQHFISHEQPKMIGDNIQLVCDRFKDKYQNAEIGDEFLVTPYP